MGTVPISVIYGHKYPLRYRWNVLSIILVKLLLTRTYDLIILFIHLDMLFSQSHPSPQGRSLHSTKPQILLSVAQQSGQGAATTGAEEEI